MHVTRTHSKAAPVVAIIQARMGSTRLPGKVLMEICGRPILWHVVNRLKAAALIDKIVVATTVEKADDLIEDWCLENGVPFFRGSNDDVLDRYCRAAKKFGARAVVRITADCPLIEPELVDGIIEKFAEGGYDHVGVDNSFPDGLDAEVISLSAIEIANSEATLASEHEHVTPYIWKNAGRFRLASIKSVKDLSHLRWTVDDGKDFLLVSKIYEGLWKKYEVFHMRDILKFLEDNPELLNINSGTMRNEGYAKSVKEDRVLSMPA